MGASFILASFGAKSIGRHSVLSDADTLSRDFACLTAAISSNSAALRSFMELLFLFSCFFSFLFFLDILGDSIFDIYFVFFYAKDAIFLVFLKAALLCLCSAETVLSTKFNFLLTFDVRLLFFAIILFISFMLFVALVFSFSDAFSDGFSVSFSAECLSSLTLSDFVFLLIVPCSFFVLLFGPSLFESPFSLERSPYDFINESFISVLLPLLLLLLLLLESVSLLSLSPPPMTVAIELCECGKVGYCMTHYDEIYIKSGFNRIVLESYYWSNICVAKWLTTAILTI